MRTYRGHKQGTIDYTKAVAEWTLTSPSTTAEEKSVAREVIRAAQEGRLEVEVVRTNHVQGRPGSTQVEMVSTSGRLENFSADGAREALFRTPGMAGAWVREAGLASTSMDARTWLKQGQPVARRIGLALWAGNAAPLAPRVVIRKGVKIALEPERSALPRESTGVSEFVVAVMERGL